MFYRVNKDLQSSQPDPVTDDSSDRAVAPSSDDESPDKPRRKRRKVRYDFLQFLEITFMIASFSRSARNGTATKTSIIIKTLS